MSTNQKARTSDSDPVVSVNGDALQVREIPAGQYLVINTSKDSQYVVDADDNHCTCPSFEYHDGICKHIKATEKVGEVDSEAGEVQKIPSDAVHHHDVTAIECPDCGEQATAGQYEVHGQNNIFRRTRILCPYCETVREEDDHSTRRDL